ncbi:MAG: hypothetical protein ACYDFT_05215 [Thermoplasmata archaeon]
MIPPERSVIFSVDEKPQTQALERAQAILPMGGIGPKGAHPTTDGTGPSTSSLRSTSWMA